MNDSLLVEILKEKEINHELLQRLSCQQKLIDQLLQLVDERRNLKTKITSMDIQEISDKQPTNNDV